MSRVSLNALVAMRSSANGGMMLGQTVFLADQGPLIQVGGQILLRGGSIIDDLSAFADPYPALKGVIFENPVRHGSFDYSGRVALYSMLNVIGMSQSDGHVHIQCHTPTGTLQVATDKVNSIPMIADRHEYFFGNGVHRFDNDATAFVQHTDKLVFTDYDTVPVMAGMVGGKVIAVGMQSGEVVLAHIDGPSFMANGDWTTVDELEFRAQEAIAFRIVGNKIYVFEEALCNVWEFDGEGVTLIRTVEEAFQPDHWPRQFNAMKSVDDTFMCDDLGNIVSLNKQSIINLNEPVYKGMRITTLNSNYVVGVDESLSGIRLVRSPYHEVRTLLTQDCRQVVHGDYLFFLKNGKELWSVEMVGPVISAGEAMTTGSGGQLSSSPLANDINYVRIA